MTVPVRYSFWTSDIVLDLTPTGFKTHTARLIKNSYSYNKMFFTISYLSGLWLFQILKGNLHFGTLSRAISLTTTIGGTILGSAVAVAVAMVARTEILNDITSDFHLPRRDCIDGDLVLF